MDRRLLRVEERLDVRRVELTHDVLCGVVRASRAVRHERESKAAIERQLAATLAKEATTQAALFRARMIAAACAVLAIGAAGSAIFGYTSMKRAQLAEHAARTSAAAAKLAESFAEAGRTQAEELLGFVVSDLSEELTAFGQLPLLVHVTQKAVAYYEGMPAAMRTPASARLKVARWPISAWCWAGKATPQAAGRASSRRSQFLPHLKGGRPHACDAAGVCRGAVSAVPAQRGR